MPIVRSIMNNLIKKYGNKKGKSIYYAMENKGKLTKAKRTATKQGHTVKKWKSKTKKRKLKKRKRVHK